jgi:hypothetical protein
MGSLFEARAGDNIFVFDGRVAEVFGMGDARRYHVAQVEIDVSGPDRKDRRSVMVKGRGQAVAVRVDAADWPAVEQLIAEVQKAAASARA